MNKLKTLKDIGHDGVFCKDCGEVINEDGWCFGCSDTVSDNVYEKAFRGSELKMEAIKWVKYWRSGLAGQSMRITTERSMRVKAFKDFFNLTEDDLK